MLAFLDSPIQLLIAAVVILIIFGPQKLPEIFNQLGRALREFKRTTSDLSSSFNMDDRYEQSYNPPRYDSYGNRVDATSATTVPEEDIRQLPASGSSSQPANTAAEPPRGDFAASALADAAEEYGAAATAPSASSAAGNDVYGVMPSGASQEIHIRPAEGAVPRKQ